MILKRATDRTAAPGAGGRTVRPDRRGSTLTLIMQPNRSEMKPPATEAVSGSTPSLGKKSHESDEDEKSQQTELTATIQPPGAKAQTSQVTKPSVRNPADNRPLATAIAERLIAIAKTRRAERAGSGRPSTESGNTSGNSAQIRVDSATDPKTALSAWLKSCPVQLSDETAAAVLELIQRQDDKAGNSLDCPTLTDADCHSPGDGVHRE